MAISTGSTPARLATQRRRRRLPDSVGTHADRQTKSVDLEGAANAPGVDACDIACEAMPGLVCGDLTPGDSGWLLDHTRICSYCSNVLVRYERVCDVLDDLDEAVCKDVATPPVVLLPKIMRAGYGRMDSPIGPLFLASSEKGLCEIGFARRESESVFQNHLKERGFNPTPDWNAVAGVARQLREYFGGERSRFEVPLDFSGISPFTHSVLYATSQVPFGRLSTYRDIATQAGRPSATRAAANALGRNPIPVIVPCHRIVRSDGSLGGYTGGVEIKEHLLSLEGVYIK